MAIVLYTGTPGAGKTLRSIHDALQKKSEGRSVFHIGIDGMKEDVIPPAPSQNIEEWRSLPPGSILIVDEAHKFFPVRAPGKPPEWIQALTEIRHFGIELWLVTQDPRNIDAFVRRLIGEHHHITRKAGLAGAMVRTFQGVSEDPNDFSNRQSSSQTPWKYPKHLFQVYKSATLHVVRPKIPKKVLFACVLLILALFGIPYLIWSFKDQVSSFNESDALTGPQQSSLLSSSSSKKQEEPSPWESPEEFIKAHTPIIAGIPHSAPIYKDLKPVGVPELLCVAGGTLGSPDRTCNCYTEQATKVPNIPRSVCESFVLNGSYNPYRPAPTVSPVQQPQGASVDGAAAAPILIPSS